MGLMSIAGLSEAFIMIRRYRELSDGQKYRYRLAKMLNVPADVYLVDELGATLDRVMAKVIAYSLQKYARRKKVMIVAASTHHDLIDDLNPDLLIFKGFGEDAQVRYYEVKPRDFSLNKEMALEKAEKTDYDELKHYHYLGNKLVHTKAWKLSYRGQTVGIISYASPYISVAMRNKIFPEAAGSREN